MNRQEFEEKLIAINCIQDCVKQRLRKGYCYECPIPSSGFPTPAWLCECSVKELDEKLSEILEDIWKAFREREIIL